MSFYTYMLRCADGSYDLGHTDDLERRLASHATGEFPGYTRSRRPVQLVWTEMFDTREEAFERERQIKGWTRRKRQALAPSDWGALQELARARGSTGSG